MITPPPVETQPPVNTPPPDPTPTPLQTQPPGVPVQTSPPGVGEPVDTEPLAPVSTEEPHPRDGFALPGGDDSGPDEPILSALHEFAEEVTETKTASGSSTDEGAHAFGLRVPLGASFGELARTAGQAVQEFAFPLTLAIAVLLFLLFQGELDRRDPKLAYAPVDSTKDMVSFE